MFFKGWIIMKNLLLSTVLVSCLFYNTANATELTKALAENKPLSEIQALIRNGANVNQADEQSGVYPLMLVKDTAIFSELIKAGADINAKTEYTSVFQQVCADGTLEMVQYLVKSGADVNELIGAENMKETPLISALRNKDPRVVEFLIQSGADVKTEIPSIFGNDSALKSAIILDAKPEIIELLIKNGANIHQQDKYSDSLYEDIVRKSSYPEVISIFQKAGLDIGKENLNYLFLQAIKNHKSMEMAKYLLRLGADPNVQAERIFYKHPVKEDYPIIVAAGAAKPDALKFLLEQKVNVNVKNEKGKTPLQLLQTNEYLIKDPNYNQYIVALGGTALSDTEAQKSKNSMKLLSEIDYESTTLEGIQKLIQEGADVNYKDEYGDSALIKSAEGVDEKTFNEFKKDGIFTIIPDYNSYIQKRLDIIDLLLKNGADINTQNAYGQNLLSIAIQCNQPTVLEHLLKKGIDVNAVNKAGVTALMKAASSAEDTKMIKLLLQYGADKTLKDNKGKTASQYAIFNLNQEVQDLLKVSTPIQKYDLPASAESYYSELKDGILKEMILPIVQNTLEDPSKVSSVMKKIDDSIDMEQVKSDSWPCLSKLPESQWKSAEQCFKGFTMDLMQKVILFTAMANGGDNATLNDPKTILSGIQKVAEVGANKAMIQHYANSVVMDASRLAILAVSADGGQGKDISSTEAKEFNGKKIACGAKLFGKKDGTVSIDFPNHCERMEESDKKFTFTVDDVIEAVKKDEFSIITCTGHHCTRKHKGTQ